MHQDLLSLLHASVTCFVFVIPPGLYFATKPFTLKSYLNSMIGRANSKAIKFLLWVRKIG